MNHKSYASEYNPGVPGRHYKGSEEHQQNAADSNAKVHCCSGGAAHMYGASGKLPKKAKLRNMSSPSFRLSHSFSGCGSYGSAIE
jgi:hypothetical protein